MDKYKLTDESRYFDRGCVCCYRIQALKDFADVKAGDLGGFVQSTNNLSQDENCWVYDDSVVFEDACVYGNAKIKNNSSIRGNASIDDSVTVDDCSIWYNTGLEGSLSVINARIELDDTIDGDFQIGSKETVTDIHPGCVIRSECKSTPTLIAISIDDPFNITYYGGKAQIGDNLLSLNDWIKMINTDIVAFKFLCGSWFNLEFYAKALIFLNEMYGDENV